MRKWVAGMLVLVSLAGCAEGANKPSSLVPECGVSSVYALLKVTGKSVSLEEVEHRFEELRPGVDLAKLSMADLRETLQSFGVHVVSIRIDPSDHGAIPSPAILYLRPDKLILGGRKPSVGHFLFLRSANGTTTEVMDFTFPGGRQEIPVAELRKLWDGEMLSLSSDESDESAFLSRPILSACLTGGLGGIVFGWFCRRR